MLDGAVQAPNAEIWAISTLLREQDIDAGPALALGLAGGAGFLTAAARGGRKGVSWVYASGWHPFQSHLVGAIDRLGMVGAYDETGSRSDAAATLFGALDGGASAVLWVDGSLLGLGPDPSDGNAPTIVIARGLVGHDVEVEVNGESGLRRVAAGTLAAARAAVKLHRHRLIVTQPPTEPLETALRAGLATMAVGPVGGSRGKRGPAGVERLGRAIGGRGFGDWGSTFDGDRHLLAALVGVHSSIRREDGLLRDLQATFERDAAERLGISALLEVAEAHAALADGWRAAAETALPADVPGFAAARAATSPQTLSEAALAAPFPLARPERDALLHDLSARVTALAATEHDALELLRSTLLAN
jgi:hypothetical protein